MPCEGSDEIRIGHRDELKAWRSRGRPGLAGTRTRVLGDAQERSEGVGRAGQHEDPAPDDDHVPGDRADRSNASGIEHDIGDVRREDP